MSTESRENENVVILDCENLTSSTVTKNKVDGVIREQLLNRMMELIHGSVLREKQKRKSEDSLIEESKRDDNFPLNYYISGERGSGKTTFLKQLEGRVKYSDYNDVKIKFLLWYDPSQSFGVPNDLFITVTAAIKTRMRELARAPYRQKEYNSNRYRFCEDKLDKLDKAIVRFSCERKALSNMSEYRASALSSEDPEMNSNIRENFRESMKLLCELEQTDAFVLVIDDVDIRTKQCYNVLEDLRLYLSNDYLVVLMAGDRENNLEHVREKFFKEYDIEYHGADRQGREARMNSTVSHAAQYFAKLFPVKQQFDLESLKVLLYKDDPIKIILRYKKNGRKEASKKPLETWLLRIFDVAISEDTLEVTSHVNTFLSLPVRNIIQMVEYWIKEGMWDTLDQFELEDSNDEQHGAGQSEEEHLKRSLKQKIEELVRIALNRSLHDQLPDLSYNYEALNAGDSQIYYDLLLKLCQETGDFEYGNYLIDKDERSQNNTFLSLVLAANFKHHIRGFKDFLSYLLYGPVTVTLYGKALEQFRYAEAELMKNPVLTSQADFRRSFENYFHIGAWRRASRWARKANMIWCYDPDGYNVHSGVVRIQARDQLLNMVKYMKKASEDYEVFCRTIAIIVSMTKSDGRDNNYYISIYSYLAYILDCVEVCDGVYGSNTNHILKSEEKTLDQRAKRGLLILLREYLSIKSCHRPEWQLRDPDHDVSCRFLWLVLETLFPYEQKGDIKDRSKVVEKKENDLIQEIVRWYKKFNEEQKNFLSTYDAITPQIMGNLWSSIYHYIQNTSNMAVQQKKGKNVGSSKSPHQKVTTPQYIQVFDMVMEMFVGYMKSYPQTTPIVSFYLKTLSDFPLTEYFNLNEILIKKPKKP